MAESGKTAAIRITELATKYAVLCHAVQSGIAARIAFWKNKTPHELEALNKAACDPKHLRTGIDTLRADNSALVALLMEKGVFTLEEYYGVIVKGMETEKKGYEQLLTDLHGGTKITLS